VNTEQRQQAVFGGYDGLVSVAGVIFGLLVHDAAPSAIAIAGVGCAIASSVSMGMGEFESREDRWNARLGTSAIMLLATLVGSLIAVWPFFVFSEHEALVIAGVGAIVVAIWIGFEKRKGVSGYVGAFVTLLVAIGLTLGIVSLIPASA
jgi:VIT1/CCC1 family predicted Fe2+/Mn2+ transporter